MDNAAADQSKEPARPQHQSVTELQWSHQQHLGPVPDFKGDCPCQVVFTSPQRSWKDISTVMQHLLAHNSSVSHVGMYSTVDGRYR